MVGPPKTLPVYAELMGFRPLTRRIATRSGLGLCGLWAGPAARVAAPSSTMRVSDLLASLTSRPAASPSAPNPGMSRPDANPSMSWMPPWGLMPLDFSPYRDLAHAVQQRVCATQERRIAPPDPCRVPRPRQRARAPVVGGSEQFQATFRVQ